MFLVPLDFFLLLQSVGLADEKGAASETSKHHISMEELDLHKGVEVKSCLEDGLGVKTFLFFSIHRVC